MENDKNFLNKEKFIFKYGSCRQGRLHYTFYNAIELALRDKKTSFILTKNKYQFLTILNEFKELNDIYYVITSDCIDVITGNILLVKIIEDINILEEK